MRFSHFRLSRYSADAEHRMREPERGALAVLLDGEPTARAGLQPQSPAVTSATNARLRCPALRREGPSDGIGAVGERGGMT
jgi:hypothetical protein